MAEVETAEAPNTSKAGGKLQGSHIWYELMTTDPEGAKRFYDAVVGWDIEPEPAGEVDYRMIRTSSTNAGGVLRLTGDMTAHGARSIWMGYIGVDNVDGTVAQIVAKGGRTLMPARDIPDVGRIAMVTDTQGNPFYVMKPIPSAAQENKQSDVFSTDAEQRVNWNELSTPDPVAARAFYGELFEWTNDESMPMGELGEYRFFDHDGVRIGAVSGLAPGAPQGWRYYIRVPSISKSVEAVEAGGGTIAMGPHEVPGGDVTIIGHDPQGAEFALVGKA